jgi:hypothetical protein
MPYPLEKGLFPLVLEGYFNEGLEKAAATDAPPAVLADRAGPKRRLRAIWRYCSIVDQLKKAKGNEASIEQVTADNSLVLSSLFSSGDPILTTFQSLMAEKWFGMIPDGTGWKRRPTSAWTAGASIGHWSGYYGNVELIMVEAFQRMLEVSIGVDHMTTPPKDAAAQQQAEAQLRTGATRVWPVYLFLTCPQPWCVAWVTWQRHDTSTMGGQVTALLQTPGHGRPIAPSPVDRVGDASTDPATGRPNPYYLVGRDKTSANGTPNSGYDGPYIDAQKRVRGKDPVAATKGQGMWAVTHENHDSAIVWSNFREPTKQNWPGPGGIPSEAWELPPIASYRCATLGQRGDLKTSVPKPDKLDGYYDIVVVAPAALDGGIP